VPLQKPAEHGKEHQAAANLARDGRLTLTLSLDGGMCELRLRARRLAHSSPGVPLAFFEAGGDGANAC
jgi:hypothetical protein